MPHDRDGVELKVGDRVMVPCIVTAIHLTTDFCNVDLQTVRPMPPLEAMTAITLNSKQVQKYRGAFDNYDADPAQSRESYESELAAATLKVENMPWPAA